eukprot:scaffold46909_cov122-Amphora_coffeaeformis.AAC.1
MNLLFLILASCGTYSYSFLIPGPSTRALWKTKNSVTTTTTTPTTSSRTSLLPAVSEERGEELSTLPSSSSSSSEAIVEEDGCWNPRLRKTLGIIASLGIIETSYLTWTKVAAGGETFCGADCASVLNGPYATVPGLGIPVATLGLAAYTCVASLALGPLVFGTTADKEEENNRLALTALSTTMGVFSVFLMTLLFGVLKESCPFCVFSAVLSISLAKLSWLGGVPPPERLKDGIKYSVGGGLAAVLGILVLYAGVPEDATSQVNFAGTLAGGRDSSSSKLLASTASTTKDPPPISTSSSPRALEISNELATLNAKMYGAYWCSHCFDQKEQLGKEAMQRIPYIECSREGTNSQVSLCKEKQIPGYPTWEINGKLFPGEQALDELFEIVQQAK